MTQRVGIYSPTRRKWRTRRGRDEKGKEKLITGHGTGIKRSNLFLFSSWHMHNHWRTGWLWYKVDMAHFLGCSITHSGRPQRYLKNRDVGSSGGHCHGRFFTKNGYNDFSFCIHTPWQSDFAPPPITMPSSPSLESRLALGHVSANRTQ